MWLTFLIGYLSGTAVSFWAVAAWAFFWPEKGKHEQVD